MSRVHLFHSYDVIIFDLDNTLYAEKDYLYAAYKAIARKAALLHLHVSEENVYHFLHTTLDQGGPAGLFEECILRFQLNRMVVSDMLFVLRTVQISPLIQLYPKSQEMLLQALHTCKVFVITYGSIEQQKNKVNHIDWCGLRKHIDIVYAHDIEPKPSPASFLHLHIPPHLRCLFIGDSEVDQLFARQCKIDFEFVQHLTF